MEKKIAKELEAIVSKGIRGSAEKQNRIFDSNMKNRHLLKKAKLLANY